MLSLFAELMALFSALAPLFCIKQPTFWSLWDGSECDTRLSRLCPLLMEITKMTTEINNVQFPKEFDITLM